MINENKSVDKSVDKEMADPNKNFVNLTYRCNNNCISCIMEEDRPREEPKLEDIKNKIDVILSSSTHIEFNGGEPTLSKHLFDIIKYAYLKSPDAEIGLLTNARMFSYKEFAEKVANMKLKDFKIITSLYGHNAELHDSITRTPGSFRQQLSGIRNLMELGIRIELRIILNKMNYTHLKEISNFISDEFGSHEIADISFVNMKINGIALKNKDAVAYRIRDSMPFLVDALTLLLKNNFKVNLYHFPHCTVAKKYRHLSKGVTAEKSEICFLPKCEKCVERKSCSGIWKNYIGIFGGSEFQPTNKISHLNYKMYRDSDSSQPKSGKGEEMVVKRATKDGEELFLMVTTMCIGGCLFTAIKDQEIRTLNLI